VSGERVPDAVGGRSVQKLWAHRVEIGQLFGGGDDNFFGYGGEMAASTEPITPASSSEDQAPMRCMAAMATTTSYRAAMATTT
jgi:hypothetical protein